MTDTSPPRLTSLSFPAAVDLSAGSKTVTFTAGATDDSSGVDYVIIYFDKTFSSSGSAVYMFSGSGSWAAGTETAQATIPVNTLPGIYNIASVAVFDYAGNESIYSASALQGMGIATAMTVSGSDTVGPQLTALSFDSTINLSGGDGTFHFSASATDRSGVSDAILRFDGALGSFYIFGSSADTWLDGTSASTSTIAVSTPPGAYHLTEVDLQDTAGNSSVYTAAQVAALGLPTSLTVTGSDTVGPTLTGLSFDPTIDLSAGAATFHFGASATDRSGVNDVVLRFDGALGSQYIFGSFADPWADGSSASTSTIAVSTPSGTYHLTEVDLYDTAGNTSVYTTAQLQAAGYATTVTVSASDVTGPTLTGFTHPTNVSLLGGAASVTFGVSATDRSGIRSAVVRFDKGLFGTGSSTAYIFGTVADPWTDGASSDVETIPTSTPAGVYTVTSLQVIDTAGNTSTYTTAQLAALGYSTTITVGGADTTPPQLTSLTFPASVNVSAAAQTITFAAAATDNATGVKDVKLTFDKNFFGGAGPGIVDIAGTTADPWTDGASSLAETLPVSTLPGVYNLTGVIVTDGAGNAHSYTAAQLQALGIATSLNVIGDSTKPTLGSLTFPSSIDVSSGQRVAAFAATAHDNATGVRDVTIHFDKDLLTGAAGGLVDLNGAVDSWSDGASTLNFIVPVTAVSGVYTVTSVTVTDGAGNVAAYSPTQLSALGIAQSLTIVGGAKGTPTVTLATTPTFASGGNSPTFSGAFSDTLALASVTVYSGATLIGGATINAAAHTWSLTKPLSAGFYSAWNVIATDVSGATASASASFTIQTGIAGQAYVGIEADYSGATLLDKRFLRGDGSVYLFETYSAGGKVASDAYSGITGQAYTSYEFDFDVTGHYTAKKYYGYQGLSYASLESDYSWSSVTSRYTLLENKYFRANNSLYQTVIYNANGSRVTTWYGLTGYAYTSHEFDYDASGHYSAQKYLGYQGLAYASTESDYSWSSVTSSYTLLETKYLRSDNSLYETVIFNANGSKVTTWYVLTGFAYTSHEFDYDASGHYTAQKYFGFQGLAYVSTESDYSWSSVTSSYTLLETKYLHSDNSLYETVIFNANGSKVTTWYGLTGFAYTSHEFDYDSSGHYTAQKYFGFQGLAYVSTESDYSWSSVTSSYTLLETKYLHSDNSLYQTVIFNANGSKVTTWYGLKGHAYTSHEYDYDSTGHYTAQKYFGYQGLAYASLESDYSWSSITASYTLLEQKYFRSNNSLYETLIFNADGSQVATWLDVTGQAYTSFEFDYDSSGHYTAQKYFGYQGLAYASLENDYSWSSVTSSYALLEQKYFRSNNSLYETLIFNADGSQVATWLGVTGQAYTSYEFDYDASGHYTVQKYFGYTGQPYAELDKAYSWSSTGGYVLTEDKYVRANASVYEDKTYSATGTVDRFYGITGKSYTSDEFDYSSSGSLLRETYYAANGLANEIITHNADTSLTYDYFQVTGTNYSSYEVINEVNGVERSQTFNYNDGTHQIDAEENNITLVSTPGDDTIYGNGAGSAAFGWGILFQFNQGFGHDLVTDFYARATASDASHLADTVQLAKTEFADFNAFYSATTSGPSGTVTTASNGDTLTLYGMTLATLNAAKSDFKFV
jgi:hypothetical protein